jgi:hypothetical protein
MWSRNSTSEIHPKELNSEPQEENCTSGFICTSIDQVQGTAALTSGKAGPSTQNAPHPPEQRHLPRHLPDPSSMLAEGMPDPVAMGLPKTERIATERKDQEFCKWKNPHHHSRQRKGQAVWEAPTACRAIWLELEHQLAHIFCQGPESKYFRLWEPCGLCPTIQLCLAGWQQTRAMGNTQACLAPTKRPLQGWGCGSNCRAPA